MRHATFLLVTATALTVGSACGAPKPAAKPDSTAALAEDEGDFTCVERKNYTPSSAFVIVKLDGDASAANRLVVNAIKDEGPFSVKLVASTGSIECTAVSEHVEIRVRGPQSFLSAVVHTTRNNVAVNARTLDGDRMLAAQAVSPGSLQQELVWGGAERAYERGVRRLDPDTTRRRRSLTP